MDGSGEHVEINQAQKAKYHMFLLICGIWMQNNADSNGTRM
jgi:hypothetical protein